jgi:thioesterase domain-containing protein
MLVPVQPAGTKPPLFFVHGMYGVMPLGGIFVRVLGSDQPLYAIHANGIDRREPTIADFDGMVAAYIAQIEQVRPAGPLRLGGMCTGCMVVVEMARRLREKNRRMGPVILADPPPMPIGYRKEIQANDLRQPHIARQMYEQAEELLKAYASRPYNTMPFDHRDSQQLHAAVLAGVASLTAVAKYVPRPFSGFAELIVSAKYALRFFHPQMPWHTLLRGPRIVHVLPWEHRDMFQAGREEVARLLKFMLDRPSTTEDAIEIPQQPTMQEIREPLDLR